MKYKTIVIDPPWPVNTTFSKQWASLGHGITSPVDYKTMNIKEIESFPINDFMDEDCNLFIWTTHHHLFDAYKILESWGLKYHCCMTWDKIDGICVYGFQKRTEFVLFGYRGKFSLDFNKKFIPTVFREKRRQHSRKPDKFYDLIRTLTPEPRIDIFAREKRLGFDVHGDQAELIERQKPLESFK